MSLVATKLQNWRVEDERLDKNMFRPYQYGALDFFVEETNSAASILSEDLRNRAFRSIGNTVQVPVINFDENVKVSNVRSCVIPDSDNTSALYNVNWKTFSVGFSMTPSIYASNEITYEHDWRRKMEKITRALMVELDKEALLSLETDKTKVVNNPLGYDFRADTIIATDGTYLIGDLDPILRANEFGGEIAVIGNSGIDSLLGRLAQYGVNNQENRALQFGGKSFHFTNQLVNGGGAIATAYVAERGNVGVLTRVDHESLNNTAANGHEWSVVRLPMLDLPVGSHYYTSVGDFSAQDGSNCGVKEYYGFSLDVAFITAYNSNPDEIPSPIVKVQLNKA